MIYKRWRTKKSILTSLIEIATGLRVHPKEIFDIMFDFEEYYANLDDIAKNNDIPKK
ncbi:hypothetical protein CJ739_1564 [Mariniflexile rhizosphaerae]|uniref:hypothetical protein n=1 Tax=unclassified Mariniflexile TaxID=2643887 RepID=UPI000CC03B43|nr:hypothetical protein [Mariniflexile sp. TRM1-10]AXP80652.1 hypothetical protein CJ739_1564 [Mariniflexile sp. TRM1-10]PLB17794.1 MAG: hypothetical protein TRG1_3377 [Flavobacteriaceae bacterium FS1-H7996/R]